MAVFLIFKHADRPCEALAAEELSIWIPLPSFFYPPRTPEVPPPSPPYLFWLIIPFMKSVASYCDPVLLVCGTFY